MGPLPFLFSADALERKKERGPRCGSGGARSGGGGGGSGGGGVRCISHAILSGPKAMKHNLSFQPTLLIMVLNYNQSNIVS
jgi:hypothetical protein